MDFFWENPVKSRGFFKSAAILSDNRKTIVILSCKPAAASEQGAGKRGDARSPKGVSLTFRPDQVPPHPPEEEAR